MREKLNFSPRANIRRAGLCLIALCCVCWSWLFRGKRSIEIYLAYAGPKGHGGMAEALNDLGYVLWDACANPVFVGQGKG